MRGMFLAAAVLSPLFGAPDVAGQVAAAPPAVEYLTSEETTSLGLPFAEAARVGDILYLSGMIGIIPGTLQLVLGGIEAETEQALENIGAILERHGSSLGHVFKCTVMLADISDWARMNAVYVTYFGERLPARSAMGVAGLALGARVEIECLATMPRAIESGGSG